MRIKKSARPRTLLRYQERHPNNDLSIKVERVMKGQIEVMQIAKK